MSNPFLESLPEPANLWARYRPKGWATAAGWWTDPIRKDVGQSGQSGSSLDEVVAPLDDVLWLAPLSDAARQACRGTVRRLASEGTPVLEQLLPGQQASEGTLPIVDWLGVLVERLGASSGSPGTDGLDFRPEAGGWVLWPLVSGLTDIGAVVEQELDRLAEEEVAGVAAVPLDLNAKARRELAELCPSIEYSTFFRTNDPDEQRFHRALNARGLSWQLPRPLPQGAPRLREARGLAAALIATAELGGRLGWQESEVQAWYRAGREVDRADRDWLALAREGNLSVLPWLEDGPRKVIEEVAQAGESRAVAAAALEYLDAVSIESR